MTRRKTDGERIAEKTWERVYLNHANATWDEEIARDIDRLIRKRMGEAWEEGWFDRDCQEADWDKNPYRGGRRKK